MEKTFTKLGALDWIGDFGRGLLLAFIGAVLTVLYESFANGFPSDWTTLKPALLKAIGVGVTAGIAYILKNLGTGSGGRLLTNQPKEEEKK